MSKRKIRKPTFVLYNSIEECQQGLEDVKIKWNNLKSSKKVPYAEFIEEQLKILERIIKKNEKPEFTPIRTMNLFNVFYNMYLVSDINLDQVIINTANSDKISTFIKYQNEMSDQKYWKKLKDVYISQDYSPVPDPILIHLFQSDRPGKEHLMNEEDKEVFNQMPDEITIYRAMSKKEYDSGNYRLSWTLNKEVAEFFSERSESLYEKDILIHEVKIKKTEAIAYFNDRNEEEIIYIKNN